jgi:phage terminase small subunit
MKKIPKTGRKRRKTGLSKRQRKIVQGKVAGLKDSEALRRAGYSESTIAHAQKKIMENPEVQRVLKTLVHDVAPPAVVARKLAEGLEATKLLMDGNGGIEVVDWDQRGKYLDRVVEWGGYISSSKSQDPGLTLNGNVNILHVTATHERIAELTQRIRARVSDPGRTS